MNRKKILIALGVILVGGAVVAANLWFGRTPALTVTVEAIKARDLEAIVSASGKIQPKRLVNISAETSGRVVDLAVNEGDRVTKGQFLLQIDPKSLRTRVDSGTASLEAAEASLEQLRQAVETARVQLDQAQKNARPPAGSVEAAAHDARSAGEGGERRPGRRVGAAGAREAGQRAGGAHRPGARRPRKRALRSEQGPHRIADRRHRHPPEHPGRRNRGHRHDEQRRHRAADARRHVGDPGGSRSRRDQHPERVARPAGEDHHRRAARPDVQGARHRDRQQPDSGDRRGGRTDAGDELQGRRRASTSTIPDVRPGFTCTADITTATRKDVDGRADSGGGRARAACTTPTARS